MKYLPSDFNNIFIEGVNGVRQPSNTYKMKIEEERVDGKIVDEVEAVKQAVYKILNTERYKHIIYNTD